jgi:D-lactate dehydrogenase
MKVLFFSLREYEKPFLAKALPSNIQLVPEESALSMQNVASTEGAFAISVFTNDDLSDPVLTELAKRGVKHIAIRATGYDHIHLPKAIELGIKVANVPNYSPNAIAEHAIALLQMLNRKLHLTQKNIAHYNFSLNGLTGFDLNGKKAGIVGTGNIGGIVARILHAFGCSIYGFDVNPNPTLTEKYGMKYVSLEEMAKECDVISIHLPMNSNTAGIFNKQLFSTMKPDALIVNTGRGGILNTREALDSLREGHFGGMALDVYEKEKGVFFFDRSKNKPEDPILTELLQHPKVVLSPHQAFLTKEALGNIADATMQSLKNWSEGKDSETQLC